MDEKRNKVGDLLDLAMEKVKLMADANTMVGTPISAGDITLIPISKISIGVGTGGTDFKPKNTAAAGENNFGGGAACGVNVDPVAFLIIRGDSVRYIPICSGVTGAAARVVELIPEVLNKVGDMVTQHSGKEKEEESTEK